jgi:4a-hydroxytetrahydrobiopterin dehydratase
MLTVEGLASEKVVERKGIPPISPKETERFLKVLPGWNVVDGAISKEYTFQSYLAGLNYAFAVGKIAEEKDHHPDILIKWRRVRLTLSTHSIGGLSENDFVIAASSELLYKKSGKS